MSHYECYCGMIVIILISNLPYRLFQKAIYNIRFEYIILFILNTQFLK